MGSKFIYLRGSNSSVEIGPAFLPRLLFGVAVDELEFTLMLQTHSEEKRVRVLQMWLRKLGQVEAYFTVREVLSEASPASDDALWPGLSNFSQSGFATLGFI